MKRNVFFGGLLFVLVMVLAGCGNTKEVAYFQDVRDGLNLAEVETGVERGRQADYRGE